MQVMFFLPDRLRNSTDPCAILDAYSYATVLKHWAGEYEGRTGTYFVLEGEEHRINATEERLASGLHFVHKLWVLE